VSYRDTRAGDRGTGSRPSSTHGRRALAVFVGIVIAVGAAVIGHSLYALPGAPNPVGWLSLGVLAIVSASFALKMPGVPVYLSISECLGQRNGSGRSKTS
jgi:hypothetical protein